MICIYNINTLHLYKLNITDMSNEKEIKYDDKIILCCTKKFKKEAKERAVEKGLDLSSNIRLLILNDK